MIEIIIGIIVVIILALWIHFELPVSRIKNLTKNIPGPKGLPIVGVTFDIKKEKGLLGYLNACIEKYGYLYKVPTLKRLNIIISNPDDAAIVLSDNELLDKSHNFLRFFKEWFGEGLVFSSETAMGIKVNAQIEVKEKEYVRAVKEMTKVIAARNQSISGHLNFLFKLTKNGRRQRDALKIIKEATHKTIRERRHDLIMETIDMYEHNMEPSDTKKRLAFLDLLLHAKDFQGELLSYQQIADEVTTFKAAGHDTTASQLSFFLYLLSRHPDIQEELYKEQCDLINEKRDATFKEVQGMPYLQRAIKESQRIYPSVPQLTRQVTKDLTLKTNRIIAPKGSVIVVFIFGLHRNPNIFPDPEKYDPDRFLPENIVKRSPFSFVPFGAGMRNFIGQKFAMLEMKTTASKLIRSFKILPGHEADGKLYEPELASHVVLSAVNGVKVRLVPR